jgi:ABC-type nitrate/sulfonate/bicarbonate transport system permease component
MKKWASTARRSLPSLNFLLLLIVAWEAASRIAGTPLYRLPPPSTIWQALIAGAPLLLIHTRATLSAAGAGLSLAVIVALTLAVIMDRWAWLNRALYPLLIISQTVPIIALAPLLLILFGLGLTSKIAVVTLVCFFPLAVNLMDGLAQVDPEAVDLLRVMQASPAMIFRSVQLPSILPYFFSGLKIAVTYSVMGAVIGEWLGARAGLGVFMIRSMRSFKTDSLFAAILVVVIVSLVLFKLTELAAWAAMPWNRVKLNNQQEE